MGCAGIDLLAYRAFEADPLDLVRAARAATEGVIMSEAFFRTLSTAYQRSAEEIIRRYNDDAAINGLELDRHSENLAVGTFRKALEIACMKFVEDPHGALLIPNWNRVTSALPDFLDRLYEAVEEDHRLVRLEETVTS